MVLTATGDVVRTGHVKLGESERLTNAYIERLFPGIRITGSGSMGISVSPTKPGDPSGSVNVNIFTLAPDSPLPPAEDVVLPAR
jgi:hypothetical protein